MHDLAWRSLTTARIMLKHKGLLEETVHRRTMAPVLVDLPDDIIDDILESIQRPTDLSNLCLTCSDLNTLLMKHPGRAARPACKAAQSQEPLQILSAP